MSEKWKVVENLTSENFSCLINTSGRQRMLSQRIVMLILHCQIMLKEYGQLQDTASLNLLRTAIDTFKTNHFDLLHGNANKSIPKIPSEKLRVKLYEEGVEDNINSFVSRVTDCYLALSSGEIIEASKTDILVTDTANDVLTQLNDITAIFEYEFNEYSSYQQGQIESQSKKVLHAIHTIKKISNQTDIISINSKIVASRAGEAGKQFKVIADRLQSLNKDIEESSDEIIDYLELVLNSNS